jgi:hypothetical protein
MGMPINRTAQMLRSTAIASKSQLVVRRDSIGTPVVGGLMRYFFGLWVFAGVAGPQNSGCFSSTKHMSRASILTNAVLFGS